MAKKRILYGNANYIEMVNKNGYFVDKTKYIEKLEIVENPVFLRPRRFGKSLWCRILECYYDINQKKDFKKLFGHTYIGKYPSKYRNSFFVLHLDFSTIDPSGTISEIKKSFNLNCNSKMKAMIGKLSSWFKDVFEINNKQSFSSNLIQLLNLIWEQNLPQLYVIIDEYDNFANKMIMSSKEKQYKDLTAVDSFFKTFFKTLKNGRKNGTIANVFITGVLPITMDDLASGFNIASFITLEPEFESMLGFTNEEVLKLLDEIYKDYEIDLTNRNEVETVIKAYYDGYHFVNPNGESLYNSTILMYFLKWFCKYKEIPKNLNDLNLKTDISWIRRLTGSNPKYTLEFVNQMLLDQKIQYDDLLLIEQFDMHQFFNKSFFPISFFYLGMLTKKDDFFLKLPNLNMQHIFTEYFNEINNIDVSGHYGDMMERFINRPDLPRLFADYWELYISQLPEAIFAQVNENFYRTTFFELCRRYLSKWFTWNMERSYPKGRSDLEFAGKYNEKYKGLRIIIEFKYISNTKMKNLKKTVSKYSLKEKDITQLTNYANSLQNEFPEANILKYIIYCIGNIGFKVFEI